MQITISESEITGGHCMGGSRGGDSGVVTPLNGQSHCIKYSTTDVLAMQMH